MPPVARCFRPVRPPVRACEQACRRRHFPAFELTFIVLLSLFLVSEDIVLYSFWGGSVAEWLACWTQAQKGPGTNRSRDAVG